MKINEKIKLPLDSNIGINNLEILSKDWKNKEIKLVNWRIIKIYESNFYKDTMIELQFRNKIMVKSYLVVQEISNFINEKFI